MSKIKINEMAKKFGMVGKDIVAELKKYGIGNTFIGVNLLHHFGIDPKGIGHCEALLPAIDLYDSIAE